MPVVCRDARVSALISLGTPMEAESRLYSYKYLAECRKPKLFISGTRDQYAPREELVKMFALAAEPKKFAWIEGAEHFFEGKLEKVRSEIESWVRSAVLTKVDHEGHPSTALRTGSGSRRK
jgi:alpha/beta superfamily hydrolase